MLESWGWECGWVGGWLVYEILVTEQRPNSPFSFVHDNPREGLEQGPHVPDGQRRILD